MYSLITKLKEMFTEMDVKKNTSVIPIYYHKDFILFYNGYEQNYDEFLASKKEYYATKKEYIFEYDEESFVENKDKIAGRMWITVSVPNEKPIKVEIMIIAQYKDEKIYKMLELSNPDWSILPESWNKP